MAREYICSYFSYLESMEALSDEECGRLYRACLRYGRTGNIPELSGNERFVFPSMKSQIDRDTKKYEIYCEKQSKNARKGGRPKKTEETSDAQENQSVSKKPSESQKTQRFPKNPVEANEKENEKDKDKEKEKDKTKEKKISPFIPLVEESGFGSDLQNALVTWLRYHQEKKKPYVETGFKMVIARMKKQVDKYGEDAIVDLICECISRNYDGIIYDMLENKKQNGDERKNAKSEGDNKRNDWNIPVHRLV